MQVYVVTNQIGTWSKKSFASVPATDNTVYNSKSAAYREAAWSKNWYLKEGFELYYREVQEEHEGEHLEHLIRVVLVNRKTDQWTAIEVNKFLVLQ